MFDRQRTAALETFARHEHLVPDTDPHRSAFLGVDRLAAQVLLVEAQVDDVAPADPAHDECGQPQPGRQAVQTGLLDDADHVAEEDVDVRRALFDDRVKTPEPHEEQEHRHADEKKEEGEKGRAEEGGHRCTSRNVRSTFP